MYVYNIYEGNRRANDALLRETENTDLERTVVSETERRRSRFRTKTASGLEVGIIVGHELKTGDILASADEAAPLLEIEIEPIPAMSIEASAFADRSAAVQFGHAVGNRHWNLTTRDGRVLVHAEGDRERMLETLEPNLPTHAEVEWEAVPPDLFDRSEIGHAHTGEHG
jgi:urease accessory protein